MREKIINIIKKESTMFVFLLIIVIIIFSLFLSKPVQDKAYAQNALSFPNAYNTNEVTHPSLINFNKKWNGYQYWLAFTPYEKGDSGMENPHVLASNNLIDWKVPSEKTNPIDIPPGKNSKLEYNSDPHLVIDKKNNHLLLFWRLVNHKNNDVIIYRSISSNGSDWSKKEIILKSKFKTEALLSPALILENNIYKMWYVNKDGKIYYRTSKNCFKWSKREEIKIDFHDPLIKPWHLEVKKIDSDYEMLVVAFKTNNPNPEKSNRKYMNLYYSKSTDNKKWTPAKIILRPSKQSNRFDGKNLYRSSFIKTKNKYVIFYSAFGYDKTAGIGITYGENIDNLTGMKNRESIINLFSVEE